MKRKADDSGAAETATVTPGQQTANFSGYPAGMQIDYNRGGMVQYVGNWGQRGRPMHANNYYQRRGRPYYNRGGGGGGGGGMRPMYPQNYNNYNYGQWTARPPFMDGPDYQHHMAQPWPPNTTVPPPPPHAPNQEVGAVDGTMGGIIPAGIIVGPMGKPGEEVVERVGKKKRRTATTQGFTSRPWNREDAEKALNIEMEYQKVTGDKSIVIRFPDPELSKEIVRRFHPNIESVHFQAPSGGRFCFVQLSSGSNVDKVIQDIEKIPFGVGKLKAERKVSKGEEHTTPEAIDPYTLYVGNLPTTINTSVVKDKFPNAARIDIGYAQKMKYTRYAFVRFSTAEAALEAFKQSVNMTIASRSIILRFRRHKGPVGPPGEKPAKSNKTEKAQPKANAVKKEKVKPVKTKEKAKKAKHAKHVQDDDDDDEDEDEDDDEDEDEDEDDDEDEESDEEEDEDDDDDDDDNQNPDDDDDEDDDEDDDDEDDDEPEEEDDDDDEDDNQDQDDDGSDDDDDKDISVDDLFEKLNDKIAHDLNWSNGQYRM